MNSLEAGSMRTIVFILSVILFGFYLPTPFAHAVETVDPLSTERRKPWTGDYDKMLKRGAIRVLIPYSHTFFL